MPFPAMGNGIWQHSGGRSGLVQNYFHGTDLPAGDDADEIGSAGLFGQVEIGAQGRVERLGG